MENTITLRLCDDDRARLDKITTLLESLLEKGHPDCSRCAQAVANTVVQYVNQAAEEKPVQEPTAPQEQAAEHPVADPFPTPEPEAPTQEAPTQEAPTQEAPTQEPEAPEEEPQKPTVTLEQIQQKVVKLAASGAGVKDPALIEQAKAKKAKVRDIINAHAPKVSELPPECWNAVWAELIALESEA